MDDSGREGLGGTEDTKEAVIGDGPRIRVRVRVREDIIEVVVGDGPRICLCEGSSRHLDQLDPFMI